MRLPVTVGNVTLAVLELPLVVETMLERLFVGVVKVLVGNVLVDNADVVVVFIVAVGDVVLPPVFEFIVIVGDVLPLVGELFLVGVLLVVALGRVMACWIPEAPVDDALVIGTVVLPGVETEAGLDENLPLSKQTRSDDMIAREAGKHPVGYIPSNTTNT